MKTKKSHRSVGLNKHWIAGKAMRKSIGLALSGLLLAGAVQAAPLKIDPKRSRIQVDAKATGHAFTGTLEDYEAKVDGDVSTLLPQSFVLKWTFDDLKTGEADRDQEMLKWLGSAKPAGSFRFTKTWEKDGKHFAMGNLTIHGVSKAIAFPYTVEKDGEWVTIDGAVQLDYTDFSLPIVRSMAIMTVKPELKVRFHLVGKL
ncbi:polyisoprenoid-binding protein YceI [Haloferula luteola]|uniref:Polyisoprenoid-binding protein YceI n=1 Tax=Haloferula luteola TaxID=595692 RepID=A0A840V2M4_9BACT|nr:YceI family protein [Haloferula luteola]MBB5352547.1 polyisoprenoid-binding protein YceI [Haloferula luteola]